MCRAPDLPPTMPVPQPTLRPMYATLGTAMPAGRGWTFEPKYDGMRVLADVTSRRIRLVTRNGRDKAAQFPEVVTALRALAAAAGRPFVIDGEIVAPSRNGAGSFQSLQGRMHVTDRTEVERRAHASPAVLVAFDLLRDGRRSLVAQPWRERRDALEALVPDDRKGTIRLAPTSSRGTAMAERARRAGWEGIIAKRVDATYRGGERSRDWLKLKLQHRAEFVVGGYTEPRNSRPCIGALLLGYYDDEGKLRYAGRMGGGFDTAGLREMYDRLHPLERRTAPFADAPRTTTPAHWVRPSVVVEVKFAEWTDDGRLRQPIYLGTRDDKPAREVTREAESLQGRTGAIA